MAFPPPNTTFSEDLYVFHWPGVGVECVLERFSETRDGDIRAEMVVNLDHPLHGGRLYSGRLLLSGPNSRRDVQRALEERIPKETVDWGAVLEQVCLLSRERYREGEPTIDLAQVEFLERPRFLLAPFIVRNGISIPYGDGGTAKSLFALRWCVELAQLGIASLYLDWEDDKETHAERLLAICNGMGVEVDANLIFYQRRTAPLAASGREIRRFVAEHAVQHVVADSVGMAAGDPNDHGLMIEAVRAARALGVAATLVHHLPKDAKDKTKPFGSVYASNEARMTWLFEKAQEEGVDELAVVLTNHKHNRGRLHPKRAYRVRFINDGDSLIQVDFEDTEVAQIDFFRSKMPQHQLIAEALTANGALRPSDIAIVLLADGVAITTNAIGTILRRHEGKLFVRREGGTWGAADTIHTV